MKKILITLSIITLSSSANSFEVKMDDALRYAIPCALSMAVAHLALKKDQVGIGAVGCGVAIGTTYAVSIDHKRVELDEKNMAFQQKFLTEFKAYQDKQKAELAVFRDTIRRTLAEKIIEERTKIEELMLKTLDKKDFKIKITSEITRMTKERGDLAKRGIDSYLKSHKERIVNRVIDEAVNKIMKKKFGGVSESVSEKSDEEVLDNEAAEPNLN